MNKVYLMLGGNQDDPADHLQTACSEIEKKIGTIVKRSSLYQTASWGIRNQPDFINQVVQVDTGLSSRETLLQALKIEKTMGRVRTVKNASRIIDIDILFFNGEIRDEEDLVIPHPRLQERRFVLVPLDELSPDLLHPILLMTVHQLLEICPDQLDVKKI